MLCYDCHMSGALHSTSAWAGKKHLTLKVVPEESIEHAFPFK